MYSFQVNSKIYSINIDDDIETIAIFGSCARGDNDYYSDIDLLIIIEECDKEKFIEKKIEIAKKLDVPIDWISLYKKSSIIRMDKYSSYFLWHLKLEGKIIYSKSKFLEQVLDNIKEYTKTESDIYQYSVICKDIKQSMKYDNNTYKYELNILASLARNICMALCYINNKKLFGRVQVVKEAKKIIGDKFPFTIYEYNDLYKFRSTYKNENIDMDIKGDVKGYVEKWIEKVEKLLSFVVSMIEGEKKNNEEY